MKLRGADKNKLPRTNRKKERNRKRIKNKHCIIIDFRKEEGGNQLWEEEVQTGCGFHNHPVSLINGEVCQSVTKKNMFTALQQDHEEQEDTEEYSAGVQCWHSEHSDVLESCRPGAKRMTTKCATRKKQSDWEKLLHNDGHQEDRIKTGLETNNRGYVYSPQSSEEDEENKVTEEPKWSKISNDSIISFPREYQCNITMDIVASDSVMPRTWCKQKILRGCKRKDGTTNITMQVADVHQPRCAMSKVCKGGDTNVLDDDDGSYVQHEAAREWTPTQIPASWCLCLWNYGSNFMVNR